MSTVKSPTLLKQTDLHRRTTSAPLRAPAPCQGTSSAQRAGKVLPAPWQSSALSPSASQCGDAAAHSAGAELSARRQSAALHRSPSE